MEQFPNVSNEQMKQKSKKVLTKKKNTPKSVSLESKLRHQKLSLSKPVSASNFKSTCSTKPLNLQSKSYEIPVEWKLPYSLDDLSTKYVPRTNTASYNKFEWAKVLGLEKSEWQNIFKFLNYKILKDCRLVCNPWNNFISSWNTFAEKTCLVFDGRNKVEGLGATAKLSSFIIDPKNIPYWKNVRLQCAKPSTSRFWLGNTLTFLTKLEFKNCFLNWSDFMEILSLFKNLTSLSVIIDENTKGGPLKYFSLFMYGLHMDKEQKFDFKFEESRKQLNHRVDMNIFAENLTNLKCLVLDVMFLELTNIFIQFITMSKCNKIEEFKIILNKEAFLNLPMEIRPGKCKNPILKTNEFLQNNGISLKKLFVKFTSTLQEKDIKLCEIPEMIQNCVVHLGTLGEIFDSKNIVVNLAEFGLELGTFSIYGKKMKAILQNNFEKLKSFIECQVNLKKLMLSDWCWPNDEKKKSALHSLIPKSCMSYIGIFVLGGFQPPYCPNWNDFEEFLISIKIQWEICNIRRLQEIMPEMTHQMPKVSNFEILNNLPICFVNFDVHIIVSKFPNLTRLHLNDINPPYGQGIPCPKGHLIEPAQFFDSDLQLIFQNLTKLEILFIKTRMYPVTDFAFTGINPKKFRKMKDWKSYKYDEDDDFLTGFRLCNLERLKSLSLIGLSYKVTDITAFIAFNEGLPDLNNLDFITSGFTKKGRKFLRNKFEKKDGFKLKLSYPKPKIFSMYGNVV